MKRQLVQDVLADKERESELFWHQDYDLEFSAQRFAALQLSQGCPLDCRARSTRARSVGQESA
eukprot:7875326-Prorocentrum_lima.AAC.1